jgi:SAM-dependent methyltransferase
MLNKPPERFSKYAAHGAYHWKQYDQNTKYRRHADRVVKWIEEDMILDIGAGDGKITALLEAAGKHAYGIDNEPEGVRLAQEKGANVALMDAYKIPYPDALFEAALMADVLEHFERPVEALREALRVISGRLYISTPPKRPDGKLTDRYHYQEWTPDELRELVEGVYGEETHDGALRGVGFRLDGEILVLPEEKTMYARFRKYVTWTECRGTPSASPSPS